MLLALLKPETRIAYFRADQDFPVEEEFRKFISAGINLTRVGAQDFGHRLAVGEIAGEKTIDLALFFADFFNYYVVYDLLKTLETFLANDLAPLQKEKGLRVTEATLEKAASEIRNASCWFGYLAKTNDYRSLVQALEDRMTAYRSYFNFNTDELPEEIRSSKTAVGEPVAQVAAILRSTGVLSAATSVFIRIDQVEELYHLESRYGLGSSYRQMINKALAMRDHRVSYRLGMRRYALEHEMAVFGTGSKLEEERDFSIVDLDFALKKREYEKHWRFQAFAIDVFERRLKSAGYVIPKRKTTTSIVREVFGAPIDRRELAKLYAGKSPERVLDFDAEWPEEWNNYLSELARNDVLSAKFGEAWARQRGKEEVTRQIPVGLPPWEAADKRWWRKERNEHALMLIASKAGQRFVWSGDMDLIELSGNNILVFITICRHIWQAWLRSDTKSTGTKQLPSIDWIQQASGVYDASRSWFEKVLPQGFNGNSRQKIVRELGNWFGRKMVADKAMSNPGHNGFSLADDELANDKELGSWLRLATGFGDLVSMPHTTKLQNRKIRQKWYLAPVLSAYFRIPHVHTKEPIYTSLEEIRKLLLLGPPPGDVGTQRESLMSGTKPRRKANDAQLSLFSDEEN